VRLLRGIVAGFHRATPDDDPDPRSWSGDSGRARLVTQDRRQERRVGDHGGGDQYCPGNSRTAQAEHRDRQDHGEHRQPQVRRGAEHVADRTFSRRGDALRWEAEQIRLLALGEFVPPSAGKMTVAELADDYREARRGQLSVRGWESDESALRVHIVPAWGRLPIGSITAPHVERFLTHLATTRSVRTAARVRSTVRGVFAYAVRTRRMVISPAAAVPLPRPDWEGGRGPPVPA
jgi:hypothetical protein